MREAVWFLHGWRVAIVLAVIALVLSFGFANRFADPREVRSAPGAAAEVADLRVDATDQVIARLGRLRDGTRALRSLQAANASAVRSARETLERSASEIEHARRERSVPVEKSPASGARFLPPVQGLAASAARRDNALDVTITWERPGEVEPAPTYELWRWTETAEPHLVAGGLAEPRYVDGGLLPGPIELGYAVFAVTGDGSGSRSESRAVQVELPAIHEIRLLEPEIEERSEPPPAVNGASEPPASAPESVRLEVLRRDDGRSEVVEVRPGGSIGQACATGMELVGLSWVELVRPIRYREPVFRSDGTLEPGEGGAQTKTFVLEARVWLPAVEVRDGWGRSLQILPPAEAPRGR